MIQPKRILLVDDTEDRRALFKRQFSEYLEKKNIPHEFLEAGNPFEAAEIIGRIADAGGGIDLLITDKVFWNHSSIDSMRPLGEMMINEIKKGDFLPDQVRRAPWLKQVPAMLTSGDIWVEDTKKLTDTHMKTTSIIGDIIEHSPELADTDNPEYYRAFKIFDEFITAALREKTKDSPSP